jgi:hypothetical protein
MDKKDLSEYDIDIKNIAPALSRFIIEFEE